MRVNDRVKDVPASALRAMFAGFGQLLGMADKLRGKTAAAPEPKTDAPERAPETAATETPAAETPAAETVADETVAKETVVAETVVAETSAPQTTESVAPEPAAATAKPKAAPKPRATAKPKAAAKPAADTAPSDASATAGGHVKLLPSDAVPATDTVAAPAAETVAAPAAALPLANYDDLTIASLRARLRNLSADQLAQLIDYEKGHANRTDVITMFERRVAKLAEG